jgi:hypothetical protein
LLYAHELTSNIIPAEAWTYFPLSMNAYMPGDAMSNRTGNKQLNLVPVSLQVKHLVVRR